MTHSKVLVTLIICFGIIVSFAIISKKTPLYKTSTQAQKNIIAITDTSSDLDTDGDGLKDWEESLIGTDPKNPDTDADGTTDGKEITQGRDPKKAGPNDKANTEVSPLATNTPSSEDDTLTAQVSRNFFGQYLLAKKGGQEVTPEKAFEIAELVMQNIPVESNAKQYQLKDITIVPKTLESQTFYIETFIKILKANPPKSQENELEIITKAVESQNPADIKKLDLIIQAYKNILTETLKIPVPKDLVPDHMIYINALSSVYTDLSEMRLVLEDPMRGYIGYAHFQKDALVLKIGFEGIQKYFNNNKGY